jgi:malonate-semialdehyde dehydrogenase (acetylating)/methylmalonate-semialdehyde dehydrogenase
MFRFRALLEAHLDELTRSVPQELGKNLDEARGDIIKSMEVVEMACGAPILMQGDALMNVSTGHDTVMYREPLGVFAGIVPFNFPAMIPFGWMIPLCITMGNTFVLKSASLTPMTSMRALELLIEAGLPKGVVNLATCSRTEAEASPEASRHPGDSYVGSTSVGLHIYYGGGARQEGQGPLRGEESRPGLRGRGPGTVRRWGSSTRPSGARGCAAWPFRPFAWRRPAPTNSSAIC